VSPPSPRRASLAGAVARVLLPAAVLAAPGLSGGAPSAQAAGPIAVPDKAKHRVVVMTDIGGDPDDRQSLVRFLLYSCDFDVEGLCTGFGWGHDRNTRPDLIHAAVDAYGKVLPNLRLHRSDYPAYERLKALVKDGHNGDPHKVGPGMDSEASEWIIEVLKRDDPRPVWFSIWGGPRELAQALWKLEKTVPAEELARLKKKIRVHSIADQDRTAEWVKTHHPDVFWIYSDGLFRGIWKEGDQEIVSPAWLEANVRTGHGPLGPLYPAKAAGKDGVKEGDTPSFFYVLPDGLSDPEHPEWGNWGGRFRRSGRGNEYIPAEDLRNGRPDVLYTIHRWRTAYQNAFEARMDWCVKPFDEANHEPAAGLGGDTTRRVLQVRAEPGTQVKLSAAGSSDPDGDALAARRRHDPPRAPGSRRAGDPGETLGRRLLRSRRRRAGIPLVGLPRAGKLLGRSADPARRQTRGHAHRARRRRRTHDPRDPGSDRLATAEGDSPIFAARKSGQSPGDRLGQAAAYGLPAFDLEGFRPAGRAAAGCAAGGRRPHGTGHQARRAAGRHGPVALLSRDQHWGAARGNRRQPLGRRRRGELHLHGCPAGKAERAAPPAHRSGPGEDDPGVSLGAGGQA